MAQENKELLLKDLCARLPYHTIVSTGKEDLELVKVDILNELVYVFSESFLEFDAFEIKPYLRLMSSMTEEEDKEYAEVIVKSQDCSLENSESATTMANDWLLSKGFDVRGLISKGLALEAPEGMYNKH
jgi:hypothetical protein